ncbi:von Willebrand factor A domain-containing protein 7-like [Chanos chanos]|uniref:von Willebrand factor A domain-containing protein 7-like n=1 Tax=Chanos chanos TaxID=29144 RepID=A0A6J2WH56_CHACN|nr:von Willebrand factor A domain-containing protein 7-like [Chanos chanos]
MQLWIGLAEVSQGIWTWVDGTPLNERGTLAFSVLFTSSQKHQDITTIAILQKTAEVCKEQGRRAGRDFVMPFPLTVDSVPEACAASESKKSFRTVVKNIKDSNALVDFWHVFDEEYHFDSEAFLKGRDLITRGVATIKANLRRKNYEPARDKLGEILHTLQDFYSHSNWIELGNKFPYSNLIRPDLPMDNIADRNTPTCRSCSGGNCDNNILESIIREKKLTSGYFEVSSPEKPNGKCSHGGFYDKTSETEPTGGINKDTFDSDHGKLHLQAADVATAATAELLEDIRGAVGDSEFLRFMGITQSSSVLCFVIDTTGSMGNDIDEVKRVTSFIIDSKRGTTDEPSAYIFVPFNDPSFGPLMKTTDPDEFKAQINALSVFGGGDEPEMCLSGLQLALTGAPLESEIFVFTDASAKDTELRSTVLALIESTKSRVNFFLTNALFSRRRRSSDGEQHQSQRFTSRLSNSLNQLYQDLSEASGGQAIEVTKATLPQATSIIVDTSSSALVTLLQAVRNPAKAENFSVLVDTSVKNLTVYITGNSPSFTIISPSGISQDDTESNGGLGEIQTVGNFYRVQLNSQNQTGLWQISIDSAQPFTIKVTGQSVIDVQFNFVEIIEEPAPAYAVLDSRPKADGNATLLVTVTGGESVKLTEVALVEASGSGVVNGTLQDVGGGDYLVTVTSVPAEKFVVRVRGESTLSRSTPNIFQRQSSTQLSASNISITTQVSDTWEPGTTLSVGFTVSTSGSGGNLIIRARNDREFVTTLPESLTLDSAGSANSTVTLTAPSDTPSGTDVTLTIEVDTPGASDSNFAVLRLSVVATVTDITPPVCEIVSVNANCSSNCSLSTWELSANLTDGNGTGIQSLTVRQGNGNLTTTIVADGGINVTLASYVASCCSEDFELVAVDEVDNVGTCFRSIRTTIAPSTSTPSPLFAFTTALEDWMSTMRMQRSQERTVEGLKVEILHVLIDPGKCSYGGAFDRTSPAEPTAMLTRKVLASDSQQQQKLLPQSYVRTSGE